MRCVGRPHRPPRLPGASSVSIYVGLLQGCREQAARACAEASGPRIILRYWIRPAYLSSLPSFDPFWRRSGALLGDTNVPWIADAIPAQLEIGNGRALSQRSDKCSIELDRVSCDRSEVTLARPPGRRDTESQYGTSTSDQHRDEPAESRERCARTFIGHGGPTTPGRRGGFALAGVLLRPIHSLSDRTVPGTRWPTRAHQQSGIRYPPHSSRSCRGDCSPPHLDSACLARLAG